MFENEIVIGVNGVDALNEFFLIFLKKDSKDGRFVLFNYLFLLLLLLLLFILIFFIFENIKLKKF